MQTPGRARVALVDALRAIALVGILQVNIQSFVWGAGEPLGYFKHMPSAADTTAWFLMTTLVSTKFMTLFALLFGFGAAKLYGRWATTQGAVYARQRMRRRLWFLLALGLAHGTLLYFGDILTLYALCGFLLVFYLGARPKRLAHAARNWGLAYVLLTLAWGALNTWVQTQSGATPNDARIPLEAVEAYRIYTESGYTAQLAQRFLDYQSVLYSAPVYGAPLIMALFLLGALAARLGWVDHPERHPLVWRTALYIGSIGLALSLISAFRQYSTHLHTPSALDTIGFICISFSGLTTALYMGVVVRARGQACVRRAIAWLAPAGRMPLTQYLTHSLLMGALLSGWGLGWGAHLSHASLAVLALLIVGMQLFVARAWIARFKTGPLEALWRHVTYAGK